jgi:eukaryotic-like serine/threonine-protein kinase
VSGAIDHNPTTNWDTETYRSGLGGVDKSGVGLYLDAGSRVSARRLEVTTSTPGFEAAVYASDTVPGDISGWRKVSARTEIDQNQPIQLDTAGRAYRYYLFWIVSLPEGNKARIVELRLKK